MVLPARMRAQQAFFAVHILTVYGVLPYGPLGGERYLCAETCAVLRDNDGMWGCVTRKATKMCGLRVDGGAGAGGLRGL